MRKFDERIRSELCFWGLGGEIVSAFDPHTEADQMAILSHLLAAYGNIVGRNAHCIADGARHGTNLFVLNIGLSSSGRKGTAWKNIRALLKLADPQWTNSNVKGGLSTGEGLMSAIRDVSSVLDGSASHGVSDKRLFVIETEFASVLKVARREGNTLSPSLRNAWDGDNLHTLTRADPLVVTDPHISIVGHITKHELTQMLTETDISNGLGNRFLMFGVQRSKELPEGTEMNASYFKSLASRLATAIEFGKKTSLVIRNQNAKDLWRSIYTDLTQGKPGLAGSLLARGAPQVLRLALIQSLLNERAIIDEHALTSAYEIFKYCQNSVVEIYGVRTGSSFADRVIEILDVEPNGLRKTQLFEKFSKNPSKESLNSALQLLKDFGLAFSVEVETNGRPAEVWTSEKYRTKHELNEKSPLLSFNSSHSKEIQ